MSYVVITIFSFDKLYYFGMSDDDFQVQNIHRYVRKTYKKSRNDVDDGSVQNDSKDVGDKSCYSSNPTVICPTCSQIEKDGEIINILHKKCPVINLAQQQLQRLLTETDILLNENESRSVRNFLHKLKEAWFETILCVFAVFIGSAFIAGLVLGTGTCSSYPGRFDSPFLTCIDNYFVRYKTRPNTLRTIA